MTGYIAGLRKVVGRTCLIQCGATVIVVDDKGELLMQRRKDNNCWGFHGGGIEPNEIVEDAARRELYEETGLVAGKLELFGVFSGPDMHYIYPNGDEVSNIDIVYICNSYSGDLKVQESEVTELRFFALAELPEDISPPQKKVLRSYLESLGNSA